MQTRCRSGLSTKHVLVAFASFALLSLGACGNPPSTEECPDNALCVRTAPKLQVSTGDRLEFTETELGETETVEIRIANIGKAEMRIRSIRLVEETYRDEAGYEFAEGELWLEEVTLPASAEEGFVDISISYTPGDLDRDVGYIEMEGNDPEHPSYRIALVGPPLAD